MRLDEKLEFFCSSRSISSVDITEKTAIRNELKEVRHLRRCLFEDGASMQSAVVAPLHSCFFGAYSYMNDGGYVRKNTFIGRYCSIGRRVSIAAGMHRTVGLSTSPSVGLGASEEYSAAELQKLGHSNTKRARHTVVMNDVWIGDGAVILPGITVGTGAIIGANAVVTKDVAPYAIVAGIPAKVIKYRFDKDLIDALLESEWWELPRKLLQQMPTGNVFEFLSKNASRFDVSACLKTYRIVEEEPT